MSEYQYYEFQAIGEECDYLGISAQTDGTIEVSLFAGSNIPARVLCPFSQHARRLLFGMLPAHLRAEITKRNSVLSFEKAR